MRRGCRRVDIAGTDEKIPGGAWTDVWSLPSGENSWNVSFDMMG